MPHHQASNPGSLLLERLKENTKLARQALHATEIWKIAVSMTTQNVQHVLPFRPYFQGIPVVWGIELQNRILEGRAQQGSCQTQDAGGLAGSRGALGMRSPVSASSQQNEGNRNSLFTAHHCTRSPPPRTVLTPIRSQSPQQPAHRLGGNCVPWSRGVVWALWSWASLRRKLCVQECT